MQKLARLYKYFQPEHYDLDLTINADKRQFAGNMTVTGHKTSTEDPIYLHAKDLAIDSIKSVDQTLEFLPGPDDTIEIKSDLPAGDHQLTISFAGKITDGMHGLYPCYYELDGQRRELLATQFESHHAREVFPCIDEPEAKATFSLALTADASMTTLSNMPAMSSSSTSNGLKRTNFAITPRMSSYLLAFVIGDLHKKTARTSGGVEVSLYATRVHDADKLDFGLDTAIRSIEFFDDYFKVPYPLPKSDHVALPDFSSGAMENWGLITYRESCLLADDKTAQSNREMIATVIAHETSHQWFGNLVTMRWWDDLWLNESFASVMEYIATDAIYPQWRMWDTYASHETLSALRRDQLPGVQSVKCQVNHPDEISTLFDPSIVYAKGARLLKMLHDYIGDQAFRDGLMAYFSKHQYGNTEGADLWKVLGAAAGKDIESFMETWISQSGFPVVSLTTTPTGYELSQQRFVIGADADERLWTIPLRPMRNDFPTELGSRRIRFTAGHNLPLLNTGNSSHFISHYDDASFELIHRALLDNKIQAIDRLALLHETTLLCRSDRLSTGALVRLLDAYAAETDHSVWDMIALAVSDLKWFVEDNPEAETNLKHFIIGLAEPIFSKLGFDRSDNDSEQMIKLRATIVSLLSYAEHAEVISRSLELFSAADLGNIDKELRPIIFGVAVKHGDEASYKRLLDIHNTTTDIELRDDAVSGLTHARNPEYIKQLLGRLTDSSSVKPQDVSRWYIFMLRNRYSRQLSWQWMTDNWQWIKRTFGGDKSYDDFARYSASVLPTYDWLARYEEFFSKSKSEVALARAIEIGLIEIKNKADWIEHDRQDVIDQLARETD